MQVNDNSSSGLVTSLNVCGGEEDERRISELVSPTGAASSFNLSLNCWLHILSQESSLDLHGDSANLAVGLTTFPPFNVQFIQTNKCLRKDGHCA